MERFKVHDEITYFKCRNVYLLSVTRLYHYIIILPQSQILNITNVENLSVFTSEVYMMNIWNNESLILCYFKCSTFENLNKCEKVCFSNFQMLKYWIIKCYTDRLAPFPLTQIAHHRWPTGSPPGLCGRPTRAMRACQPAAMSACQPAAMSACQPAADRWWRDRLIAGGPPVANAADGPPVGRRLLNLK